MKSVEGVRMWTSQCQLDFGGNPDRVSLGLGLEFGLQLRWRRFVISECIL